MADNKGMFKTGKLLDGEVLDLADAIALVSPTDTPLYTILAGRGQIVPATDITVTWRQKDLNTNRDTLIVEGAEAGSPIHSGREMKLNYCQIIERVTSVSGTVRALAVKGIGDEFLAEIKDRMIEVKQDLEYYFLQGTKAEESGATPRQMNGLLNLVENTVDLGGKGITEDAIVDALESIWDTGASGEFYGFVNSTMKRAINKILADNKATRVIADTTETNDLGIRVERVVTDFGILNLVLDRFMPKDQLLIVDIDQVQIAELRTPFYEDLAKTGDYSKGHIIAESSIKLLNTKAGAKIIGLGDKPVGELGK